MKKETWIALGLTVLGVVVALAVYNVWLKTPVENALSKI